MLTEEVDLFAAHRQDGTLDRARRLDGASGALNGRIDIVAHKKIDDGQRRLVARRRPGALGQQRKAQLKGAGLERGVLAELSGDIAAKLGADARLVLNEKLRAEHSGALGHGVRDEAGAKTRAENQNSATNNDDETADAHDSAFGERAENRERAKRSHCRDGSDAGANANGGATRQLANVCCCCYCCWW